MHFFLEFTGSFIDHRGMMPLHDRMPLFLLMLRFFIVNNSAEKERSLNGDRCISKLDIPHILDFYNATSENIRRVLDLILTDYSFKEMRTKQLITFTSSLEFIRRLHMFYCEGVNF